MSNENGNTDNQVPKKDGQCTLYYDPGLASDKRPPIIYYVNGMNTTPDSHKKHALTLSELVNVKVLGVYNEKGYQFSPEGALRICPNRIKPILSLLPNCRNLIDVATLLKKIVNSCDFTKDLNQSIWDMLLLVITSDEPKTPVLWPASNVTRKATHPFLSTSNRKWLAKTILNYNPCIVSLMDRLESEILKSNKYVRIHIIAHSQGNLITSNALGALNFCMDPVRRKHIKVTVYALASPAWTWPKNVKVLKYTHLNDPVTWPSFGKSYLGASIKYSKEKPFFPHDIDIYMKNHKFISELRKNLEIPKYFRRTIGGAA